MKTNIFNFNSPFPFINETKDKIVTSFLFSIFVFTFLITFQPFGISKIKFYKPLFVLGYSCITFLVLCFGLFLLPYLFKNHFNPQNWTVKKMFFFTLYLLILISILNWIYTVTVGTKIIIEQKTLIEFLFITLSVGIFPIAFFIILAERLLTGKNEISAKLMTSEINKSNSGDNTQNHDRITLEYENDTLSFEGQELVCIKSEGNYAEIYLLEDKSLRTVLIRSSLTRIMHQLENLGKIQQCHRSFIVNFQHVTKVSGNARNYNLHFNDLDFSVPVSRNFSRDFIDKIKK